MERHVKLDFPRGIRPQDQALLLASRPGGIVCAGGRSDRSSHVLGRTIEESQAGAAGADAAVCLGKSNRREGTEVYQKPEQLKKALEELYEIGQDGSTPK